MEIFDEVPRKVLTLLCDSTDQRLCFSDILEKCDVSRSRLSEVLAKFDEAEMIVRQQESGSHESLGRAPRVYYSATETAITVVRLLGPSA